MQLSVGRRGQVQSPARRAAVVSHFRPYAAGSRVWGRHSALGHAQDEKGSAVPLRGVLGPVTVWRDGHEVMAGQPRQLAVLGLLASRANRVVSRAEAG
jgi:DNA-binding response OmpR family regulator